MSPAQLLTVPVVLPLVAAGLALVAVRRPRTQQLIGLGVLGLLLADAVALVATVRLSGPQSSQMGGWPAPWGIEVRADMLSALMLLVSTAMLLAVYIYALGSNRSGAASRLFHPVYLALAAGVSLCFLTGDLFNLFVAFEIMLSASYVLITLGATRNQVRSGMTYVVISLVASVLFVSASGLIYAATGTLNMADLAVRLSTLSPVLRQALGLLFLGVFGIKAGIFPLFFWLPDSYPTAPSPVTAIFAGLLTKVGVYAIIRTQTLMFATPGPSTFLLIIASATMLIGVLGAIAQDDVKRILSFHIVSQIGYMVFGIALFSVAGVAGAIFYIVHHIVVKTALFLVGGLLEERFGTGALHLLGGVVRRAPVIAVLFAIPALSLAGLPPFSGFIAKLALVRAGLAAEAGLAAAVTVAVSLLVSVLTLFSMTKIWAGAFWGAPERPTEAERHAMLVARSERQTWPLMLAGTAAVVVLSLVVTVCAGGLWALADQAARQLLAVGVPK